VTPSKGSGGIPRRPARRWTYSLLGLHRVPIDLQLLRGSAVWSPSSAATYWRIGDGSTGSALRRARPNARRRSASSAHSVVGCNHAPRPGAQRRGSGITLRGDVPGSTTTRSNSAASARLRHPMHVRIGRWSTSDPSGSGSDALDARTAINESTPRGRACRAALRAPAPQRLRAPTWRAALRERTRRHCGCRFATQ
jgi:hypothetical protein